MKQQHVESTYQRRGVRVLRWLPPLLLSIALGLASLTPTTGAGAHAADEQSFSPAIQHQFQAVIDQELATHLLPGAIVGIWVPGQGTWIRAEGLADVRTKQPMHVDSSLHIGSITKTFIGTLILQLVQEGKLRLDQPISTWVPQLPNAQQITVRDLLNMSSGLHDYTLDILPQQEAFLRAGRVGRQWSPEQLVQFSIDHKPSFAPGKGYEYANVNYVLLGMIIERATGQKVEDVLQSRILQPLGLRHTLFPTTTALPSTQAHEYWPHKDALLDVTASNRNMSWIWTAGAMISTLDDLRIWARAVATGALISPNMQRQLITGNPNYTAQTHGSGLFGLGITGAKVGKLMWYGYNGAVWGSNADEWYLPSRHATIVVLANSYNPTSDFGPAEKLALQFIKIVSSLESAR
jgi:D-alanyl-D-alanine carboxypeptidase